MVVIGHSQGGLLTKLTATETTNALWAAISKKPVEELKATEEEKAVIRRYFYMDPLPCVKRVVFISTPHRGSFLAGNFLRNLIRKLVSTPSWMAREGRTLFKVGDQLDVPKEMTRKQMTSIDSMSPKNPTLRALAELPVTTNVTAHSIIAVKEKYPDIKIGNDGVVEYTSAHVDYSESEFIARSFHSCQSRPEVIEEVRRILHQHLDALTPGAKPKAIAAGF